MKYGEMAATQEERKGPPNRKASSGFSLDCYKENQTFKRLKEEDPSGYRHVRDTLVEELERIKN